MADEAGTEINGEVEEFEGERIGMFVEGAFLDAADRLASVVEDILADQTRARREKLMGALLDYHKARR